MKQRHGWKIVAGLMTGLSLVAWAPAAAADELETWSSESDWDIPGEYVVDYRDDTDPSVIDASLDALGVGHWDTDLADETRIEIVKLSGATESVLDQLRDDPSVESVEPHARVHAMFVPDDPLYEKQWHMNRVGAENAWHLGIGRGVTVAVIDTGIACENFKEFTKATDLMGTRCVDGHDFVKKGGKANDDHGHGTHVAGTIAQSTNNGIGGAGLAFGAWLMPVKVLSADGWGTNTGVADGIRWAAENGAQVINLSLGSPRNSSVLQDAVDYAVSKGVVVVAAAGNSGGAVGYPGGSEGVIGVSATDANNGLAWFSSRGKGVDIAAPGVNVTQQTICDRGRNRCEIFPAYNGTSMASPHVAGAAALLVGMGVTDPAAVEDILFSTTKQLDDSDEGRRKFGAGLVQADAAMDHVLSRQIVARLLALVVMAFVAFRWARKRGETISKATPSFWLTGLATAAGLLFFAPWVLSRHDLWVDMASRPIADWDIFMGASLHKWLPLAHVGVPLALTVVLYRVRRAAGLLGGIAVGTAAYLGATIALGQVATPFGWFLATAWFAVNTLLCLYLASLVLVDRR